MIKEVIILAGGLGTRLKEVISDIPKVMALINGKPFLEYQLNYLEKSGINRVVLSVGYKNEIIRNHFNKH
jgi:D-glycero-alpha-D-manno-heptose 1-phosphate guanylyltransferase